MKLSSHSLSVFSPPSVIDFGVPTHQANSFDNVFSMITTPSHCASSHPIASHPHPYHLPTPPKKPHKPYELH